MFAGFAEPVVVLDPVVTVVMRLLVPPAMADDRIAQTEGDTSEGSIPHQPPSRSPACNDPAKVEIAVFIPRA